jgi:hypothetical protein
MDTRRAVGNVDKGSVCSAELARCSVATQLNHGTTAKRFVEGQVLRVEQALHVRAEA